MELFQRLAYVGSNSKYKHAKLPNTAFPSRSTRNLRILRNFFAFRVNDQEFPLKCAVDDSPDAEGETKKSRKRKDEFFTLKFAQGTWLEDVLKVNVSLLAL